VCRTAQGGDPYHCLDSDPTTTYEYQLALLFRDGNEYTGGIGLKEGLHLYIEHSNEGEMAISCLEPAEPVGHISGAGQRVVTGIGIRNVQESAQCFTMMPNVARCVGERERWVGGKLRPGGLHCIAHYCSFVFVFVCLCVPGGGESLTNFAVWNFGFPQYNINKAMATWEVQNGTARSNLVAAVPGRPDINCTINAECWAHRRHARRVYEISQTFAKVFGPDALNNRVRMVYASWTINQQEYYNNTLSWLAAQVGPVDKFIYAIAAAQYFGPHAQGMY